MPKIKGKISSQEFESLSDPLKEYYTAQGDSYYLQTEDMEHTDDVAALKNAKDYEVKTNKKLREEIDKLKADTSQGADVDAVRKEYEKQQKTMQTRYENQIKELNGKLEQTTGTLKQTALDREANSIASSLFTAPSVGMPHIKSRLTADFDDKGNPVVKVLDKDGNLSDLTPDDLKKEFVANKDFAAIIKGSDATGSGSPSPSSGAGSGGVSQAPDYSKMSLEQKTEYLKQNPSPAT